MTVVEVLLHFVECWLIFTTPGVRVRFKKGKCSLYSITERRFPELIPVLGSQPAGDVSHKPGGRLPLPSTRPAVTLATLNTFAATDVLTRHLLVLPRRY